MTFHHASARFNLTPILCLLANNHRPNEPSGDTITRRLFKSMIVFNLHDLATANWIQFKFIHMFCVRANFNSPANILVIVREIGPRKQDILMIFTQNSVISLTFRWHNCNQFISHENYCRIVKNYVLWLCKMRKSEIWRNFSNHRMLFVIWDCLFSHHNWMSFYVRSRFSSFTREFMRFLLDASFPIQHEMKRFRLRHNRNSLKSRFYEDPSI